MDEVVKLYAEMLWLYGDATTRDVMKKMGSDVNIVNTDLS